jgi:hypothetical protein
MWRCALAGAFSVLLVACGEAASEPTGTVVIGVTSDFVPGPDIGRIEVEVRVGESAPVIETWTVGGLEELAFPLEVPLSGLPDGASVGVVLSAYDGVFSSEAPFLTRRAATSVVEGRSLLLRVHLEWECVSGYHVGSGVPAPDCIAPRTCIHTGCEDPYVPPAELEAYSPAWAVDFADECRPLEAGEPEVTVGQGESSFSALSPGAPVIMHAGPQGGHHVWLALRARNLHRAGSITTLEARRSDSGEALCSVKVPLDFAPSEAGSCDLAGIRCVVGQGIDGASKLAGQEASVSVKVVDSTGNVGLGQQQITLALPP